jgi:preprotein translocase subunit SecD
MFRSAMGAEASSAIRGTLLFDRKRERCYFVGPTLLTGARVETVSVFDDAGQEQWAVNANWNNNDLVTKVAKPYVNQEIAVVLNGAVVSTLVFIPSFSGRDLEIEDNFGRNEALNIAASIMGIRPSQVKVDAAG